MRRRRFLKAVLGAGVAAVIPIPGPRPITIDDCLKGAEEIRGQTMNLTCIDETQTLITLNEIFKRTYYGKFDHASYIGKARASS